MSEKSPAAPMKAMSLSRLDLMRNLVLACLIESVRNVSENTVEINKGYHWTESRVLLSWIKSHSQEVKISVKKRIQEIRKLAYTDEWFSCKMSKNPADLITRATEFKLIENKEFRFAKSVSLKEQ